MNNEKLGAAPPKHAGRDAKQAIKFTWPYPFFPRILSGKADFRPSSLKEAQDYNTHAVCVIDFDFVTPGGSHSYWSVDNGCIFSQNFWCSLEHGCQHSHWRWEGGCVPPGKQEFLHLPDFTIGIVTLQLYIVAVLEGSNSAFTTKLLEHVWKMSCCYCIPILIYIPAYLCLKLLLNFLCDLLYSGF